MAQDSPPPERVPTFAELEETEVAGHEPIVVLVDGRNRIVERRAREVPGPARRTG